MKIEIKDEDVKRLLGSASNIFEQKLKSDNDFAKMCAGFCAALIKEPIDTQTDEDCVSSNNI